MADEIVVLCEGCGEVFAAFLKQMSERNQKITCPYCEWFPEPVTSEMQLAA